MRQWITIIGSGNGLAPGRRQAITWTNAGILLIWTLGTNLPDGTKPLPEPMLTCHQLDSVALT